MSKDQFAKCWEQCNRNQRRAIMTVAEAHLVSGKSIAKVVKENYRGDSKDFHAAMINFSQGYVRFRMGR